MNAMQIEILDSIKLPLVTRLYKAHYRAGKAKKDELIIVGSLITCENQQKIISVVRFKNVDRYRLLTGMLVIPEYRHFGFGHQLMNYCAEHVLTQGDFCFAYTHLQPFYAQHGFEVMDKEDLPNSLKSLFEGYARKKSLVAMKFVGLELFES